MCSVLAFAAMAVACTAEPEAPVELAPVVVSCALSADAATTEGFPPGVTILLRNDSDRAVALPREWDPNFIHFVEFEVRADGGDFVSPEEGLVCRSGGLPHFSADDLPLLQPGETIDLLEDRWTLWIEGLDRDWEPGTYTLRYRYTVSAERVRRFVESYEAADALVASDVFRARLDMVPDVDAWSNEVQVEVRPARKSGAGFAPSLPSRGGLVEPDR